MFKSIRSKILSILILISSLTFVVALLGILMMNKVARRAHAVITERVPLTHCAEEAQLAILSGRNILNQVLIVQDSEELNEIRNLEGRFRDAIINFDMFIRAMIWGSESEAFKRASGGLTF